MERKTEYEIEKLDKVALFFIIGVLAIVVISVIALMRDYFHGIFDGSHLMGIVVMFLIFLAILWYAYIVFSRIIKAKACINKHMSEGIKYPARIVKSYQINLWLRHKGGRMRKRVVYKCIVNCNINGVDYNLPSKELIINPKTELVGRGCNVYVLGNRYIITDFQYKNFAQSVGINIPMNVVDLPDMPTKNARVDSELNLGD